MEPGFESEDLEETLLRAGRDVRMSPELRQKTLVALGVGAVGVTSAATAKAGTLTWLASKPSALLGAGLVGALGVAGAVAIGGGWSEEGSGAPPAPSIVEPAPRQGRASSTEQGQAAEEAAAEGPELLEEGDRARDAAGPSAPSTSGSESAAGPARRVDRRGTPASVSASAGEPTSLGEELAQLGRVEAALQAKRPGDALARLAEYRERFPRPQLGLEAEVLTIQALAQSGSQDAARTRAARFLERHPTSPLGARVKRYAE